MNKKTQFVFNGWLELSQAERDEFENAVREYNSGTYQKRVQLTESTRGVAKMETGPLGRGCPCCGR
jgi:hypothetical protein